MAGLLKIANNYGNFDLFHDSLPRGYVHIPGQRLQPLATANRIRFVPAVVDFVYSGFKKYGSRPKFDGIIVTAQQAEKMRQLIAARDEKRNDPKSVAARDRAKQRRDEKKQRLETELNERASAIGYLRGSRCEAWLLSCQIDEAEAEVIAFKARYRHEFTDYDSQYERHDWDEMKAQMGFEMAKYEMRFAAREEKVEDPIPKTWDEYLRKYDFNSPQALAMANTLADPAKCHPVWFKACEVGLRGQDLNDLTYERIRDAKVGTKRDRVIQNKWNHWGVPGGSAQT